MESIPICPQCGSDTTYFNGSCYACPECFNEFTQDDAERAANAGKTFDVNSNELQNGDTVIVVKDLPVKGAPKPVKAGTKVKNIRLVEGDHNIACKIDGFGAMGLKSVFVRKA